MRQSRINRLLVLGWLWAAVLCVSMACQKVARPAGEELEVKITLDDSAKVALANHSEKIKVSAYYYGRPTVLGRAYCNSRGEVELETRSLIIDAERSVQMRTPALDSLKSRIAVAGEPRVLLNVTSARTSIRDNILECSSYDNELVSATASPITLNCSSLR